MAIPLNEPRAKTTNESLQPRPGVPPVRASLVYRQTELAWDELAAAALYYVCDAWGVGAADAATQDAREVVMGCVCGELELPGYIYMAGSDSVSRGSVNNRSQPTQQQFVVLVSII